MKKKMHIVDIIFIIGILALGLLGGFGDAIYWKDVEQGGFPVFTIFGIMASGVFWLVMWLYSDTTYVLKDNQPRFVKWYSCFLIPIIDLMLFVGVAMVVSFFNI